MGLMSETDRRFINLERKLGIFVIVAISGIALLIALIGIKNDIFVSKARLYTIADSGKGLYEGMEVKLSGFSIGKVKKMYLDDITKVKMEMSINRDYLKWIKTDSKAILAKEGLIGESIIELTAGSPNSMTLDPEAVVPFVREVGLSEIAEDLKGDINKLLSEIGEIIHYINNPEGDIKLMLTNLNRLSSDLLEVSKSANLIINNTDKRLESIVVNFNTMLNSATETVEEAKLSVSNLDPAIISLESALEKADSSMENLQAITDDLKNVVQAKSPNLAGAISKGERVMGQAGDVLESLKNTWPISDNIKTSEKKSIKVDSYE